MSAQICLASRSPRRRALLARLGFRFHAVSPDVDERALAGEAPAAFVRRVACDKARAGRALQQPGSVLPVLAADTAVVVAERIMGKPRDREDALAMLASLSGRWHHVLTAVAVAAPQVEFDALTSTRVRFRRVSGDEARAYWDSGEPHDKAGAYAIQGIGGAFVAEIQGSYTGVVGLPLVETLDLLARIGIQPPRLQASATMAAES